MLRWSTLVVVAVSVALVGCGSQSDSPASKAFGGLSDSDMTALRDWSAGFGQFPDDNIAVVKAFSDNDFAGAADAVDELNSVVTDTSDAIVDFDNPQLRDALTQYMEPFERLVDAYQRVVDYYSESSAPADSAAENDMVADIQQAARDTRRADRALLRRLTDVMSADQRREFLDGMQQMQDDYERKAQKAIGQ